MLSTKTLQKKNALLLSALVSILTAGGCAQHTSPAVVAPANPANTKILFTGLFSYPESAANGWSGKCPASAPASNPVNPPPTVQQSPIDFTKLTSTPAPTSLITVNVVPPGSFDAADDNIVFATVLTMTVLTTQGATKRVYTPLGFHFHSPVEHTLPPVTGSGITPPQLEMHIKAVDKYGKVSVFVVQYQTSTAVTVNSQTLDALIATIANNTANYQGVSMFNTLYEFQTGAFYSYVGSLTTPPCSTGVQFYVSQVPQQIPPAQMVTLLSALTTAGWPVNSKGQPANNRVPQQFTSPQPVVTLVPVSPT
jgi:carbonic anhydrase